MPSQPRLVLFEDPRARRPTFRTTPQKLVARLSGFVCRTAEMRHCCLVWGPPNKRRTSITELQYSPLVAFTSYGRCLFRPSRRRKGGMLCCTASVMYETRLWLSEAWCEKPLRFFDERMGTTVRQAFLCHPSRWLQGRWWIDCGRVAGEGGRGGAAGGGEITTIVRAQKRRSLVENLRGFALTHAIGPQYTPDGRYME